MSEWNKPDNWTSMQNQAMLKVSIVIIKTNKKNLLHLIKKITTKTLRITTTQRTYDHFNALNYESLFALLKQ